MEMGGVETRSERGGCRPEVGGIGAIESEKGQEVGTGSGWSTENDSPPPVR